MLYKDPTQPVEKRLQDLLSRMTLEEKVAQLGGWSPFRLLGATGPDPLKMQHWISQGIGQISAIAGNLDLPPDQVAVFCNAIQRFLVEHTRLGIPAIIHEECLSGYRGKLGTLFPQIIGLASTWQPELAEQMTAIIRQQLRSTGNHQALSPVLDVARDPRWGRVEETYGEDPYLVARMGTAYIQGLQGEDPLTGVIATGKHFLGYSAAEGGLNWAPVHVGPRELYEVYARPFEAATRQAKLGSIMNSYSEIDGVPCAVNPAVLTDLLRRRLGFTGFVVSDYMAIRTAHSYHQVAVDLQSAGVQAVQAGLNVELPEIESYGDLLVEAVRKGMVTEAEVERLVSEVLEAKFRLGLFETPYVDPQKTFEIFARPAGPQTAHQIALQSLVLLKNQGNLLPLKPGMQSIAVIGPNADNVRNLLGDYAYPALIDGIFRSAQGQMEGVTPVEQKAMQTIFQDFISAGDEDTYTRKVYGMRSILDGIRAAAGPGVQVSYAQGCQVMSTDRSGFAEAIQVAQGAEVVILVLGDKCGEDSTCTSGEAVDRADLCLPGVQQQLLEEVAAVGKPVVLVLVNGRPLAIPWAAEHIPAILEAWIPGQEGGRAVAEVLFGQATPGGKLPISLPRSVGQVPVFYGHRPSGGRTFWLGDYIDSPTSPLYPFGFGLSYTAFGYSNLQLSASQVDSGASIQISCLVTNTGRVAGDEIVQLYLHDREADVSRPVLELAGFKRLSLAPGQSRTVRFTVQMAQLGFTNRSMQFIVEPGNIDVLIGASSADIRLQGEFAITGPQREVSGERRVFFSDVEVI